MQQRKKIQFFIIISLHHIKYKSYYLIGLKCIVFENHITYPFTKYACPITFRNKTLIQELVNNTPIKFEKTQNLS